ncbi:agarase, putative [Acanthamoeba castellanii str. Neff]|uniref:Agarase, putative n=1 Tax=Acanthamoeba castellanii (strain ATCC 30010 / Neff) TaxID=1257118 RepID=L8HAP0_ACACF|nr:agarase, putative [Acanthamoeba castellanii str. Neff]ELR22317.1 agarase, putative [Acanthamoeba castellanii str. Neff]
MTRISPLLLLLGVAIFCSTLGDGAINFGCFFTVGQSASGAWWLIDPKGQSFFSVGVDVVNYGGDSTAAGVAAYNDAVKAKFGNQSAWADSVVSRIDSWKLNTLGAWADSVVITKGMPYTRALSLGKTSGPWLNGLFPDVFDPAWIASVDTKANSGCTPYRNDPTLIGYFLDNEMWWGPIGSVDDWRAPGTILDQMLIGLNTTSPGRIRAVSFLQKKYSTIAALNKAWNTTYASYDAITTMPPKTTAHTNDTAEFTYIASVQFFNVTRTAIRKYDPYHMLLGVRFIGAGNAQALKACAEYNEVVSINSYPSTSEPYGPPTSRIDFIYNNTKRPILVGEFAYKGNDTGLPNTKGAGLLLATQAERAQGYKNYTTRLAKLKPVIGMHWFQWSDQPAAGRSSDGENSNFGLVNKDDNTYTTLTEQMKLTNPQLSTLHDSSPSGLSAAKCYSTLACPNKCSGHGCCDSDTGLCSCDGGFKGADCGTDVNSFGSALDTTVWSTTSSATGSQAYKADQVSTSSNQLKLAITPCTASPCGGYNFTAGGIITKTYLYGFGIYTARFKAPSTVGFTAQMELNSGSNPRDIITLRIRGNLSQGALDYVSDGTYKYLKWVGPLPFANPSTGFHNYSIHYMPTYFAYYADGVLLGTYNSTTATSGLPDSTMALSLYISAANDSPKSADAMWVSNVSYQLVGGTEAVCPSSSSSRSAAARAESSVFSWLRSFV